VPDPALSIVLVTDVYPTIERVVRTLREQTVHERLEVVIVTSSPQAIEQDTAGLDEFAAVRVIGVESLVPLAAARGVGVRTATAPLVFVGETHTFPHPGWAEALIEAHTGPWSAVVPGFGNANPSGGLSWASFLADYGAWLSLLPHRELTTIPTYNSAYKRTALLALEPRLDDALTTGDELIHVLRASGQRFVLEPAARIDHVNIDQTSHWLMERYLGGLLIAHSRMQLWSWRRRALYAAGSPLIPAVLLARVRHGVAAARRTGALPVAAYPALLLGVVVGAIGELVGYVGGRVEWAERRMTEYELHKLRYLRSR
jgi:Glycosyl transferase family 2